KLTEWQKSELKAASDKSKYYGDVVAWFDLQDARKAYGEFHFYFLKHGIFIHEGLKSQFAYFDNLFHEVLVERELSLQHKDWAQKFEKGMRLHEEGRQKLSALESDVQRRLWNSKELT